MTLTPTPFSTISKPYQHTKRGRYKSTYITFTPHYLSTYIGTNLQKDRLSCSVSSYFTNPHISPLFNVTCWYLKIHPFLSTLLDPRDSLSLFRHDTYLTTSTSSSSLCNVFVFDNQSLTRRILTLRSFRR